MKKNLRKITFFFIALFFILFSFVYSLNKSTYDLNYYRKYSIEHNIKDYVEVEQNKLEEMYGSIQNQIKTGDENYLKPYFNDREISHMKDVSNLFSFAGFVQKFSSIFIIIFIIYFILSKYDNIKLDNIKYLRNSLIVIILLILIFALFMSFDFSSAFIKFHHLFFDNDLWILDPKTDIMIRMLPEHFFLSIAINILLKFLSIIIGLIIIFTIYLNLSKKGVINV